MRAASFLRRIADERWFIIVLLGASAALLILVSIQLGRKFPPLPTLNESLERNPALVPVDKIEQLSSTTPFLGIRAFSGTNHPFYTLNFQPPPPAPPTPVPTTAQPEPPKPVLPPLKKLALLYQGVYETAIGDKKAFLQIDGKLAILPQGSMVAADWSIAEIGLKRLTLTNRSAQTNVVEFNRVAELEVPAK